MVQDLIKKIAEVADLIDEGEIIAGGQRLPEKAFETINGKKSSITENKDTLKIWKDIVKGFKDAMLKGAWVINPNNGAKEYYKNHCYTLSAKKLFQKGIKITPYAGWNEYILNEEIV